MLLGRKQTAKDKDKQLEYNLLIIVSVQLVNYC